VPGSYFAGIAHAPTAKPDAGISRSLVLLLAVACGAAVANLYYAQPLLHTIAGAFGVSEEIAGLLMTVIQVGYVLGLAFLVPLGDLRERRGLISLVMLVTAAGLALAAVAPTFVVLGAVLGIVGITSAVAQVIVPMSSSLAAEHERGRVVGMVMSGLLVGILVARTLSGLIAGAFGWRTVFVVGAAVMLVLAAVLRQRLPRVPPTTELRYGGVLRSVLVLIREEPVLRQRMMLGALDFGCFSALWTTLAFLLSAPPYGYGNAVIGLFGLAGVAGAVAASMAGRLADRGLGNQTTTASIVILLASWALVDAGRTSAVALIIGIAVLDFGAQALHISNQSAIYALHPDARSRLTTGYMVSCFIGASLLSALGSAVYASSGWNGVCILGAVTAGLALVVWTLTSLSLRSAQRRFGPARSELE
jgi:predicted MFS family arabinose efflux permease